MEIKTITISIWWKAFFAHCSRVDGVVEFKDNLAENIFSCMEMSGQSYTDTILMPVQRFYKYLKWKTKLEEEKQKRFDEEAKQNG